MRLITSVVAAFAVCALTVVHAEQPKPMIGHTATLIDNTVFIQGGSSALNVAQNSAFSLILGKDKSIAGATLVDHTTFSKFRPRDFHVSINTNAGLMVNCGSLDNAPGPSETFTCDVFDVIQYNSTAMTSIKTSAVSRGGMASAVSENFAFFLGGSGPNDSSFSNVVNTLVLGTLDRPSWRVDTNMPTPIRFHTATYVSGTGVVVLGGQIQSGAAVPLATASVLYNGNWTTRAIAGTAPTPRFGHSAVLTETGTLYIYGGKETTAGAALNDVFSIDTNLPAWTWTKVNVPTAEPRAFHASVILPDEAGTILHTFGQTGAGIDTAVNTFSSFNPKTNTWNPAFQPPAAVVATESPVKKSG
ncbi:kelch domain-containing protein 3 [Podila epigama]|nr:kelch domain-containing protein 3 [Podila epigama]